MDSIILKNKYFDTTGIYDTTAGKTQDEINAEKYTKPSGGIPKADLANAVQVSLNKADSAIQQHQSLSAYRTSAAQDTIDAGKVNTSDYNPTPKTSAMTNPVGKDANGGLWTTPVASADIASATETWLEENIAQETGYVIDSSLSTANAAADAKAAGDRIKALEHNISLTQIVNPYNEATNGHFQYYTDTDKYEMPVYDLNGQVVGTVMGSDYIYVPKGSFINIIPFTYNSSTGAWSNGEVKNTNPYIYFYNLDKEVIWNIIDYNNTTQGKKNLLPINYLKAQYGFQIHNTYGNCYVRVAEGVSTSLRRIGIAIWDGQTFGVKVTASNKGIILEDSKNIVTSLPSDGTAIITIPGWAEMIIAKPPYTIKEIYTTSFAGNNWSIQTITQNTYKYPTQIAYTKRMASPTNPKNAVIVKDYNYSNSTYSNETAAGDISDYVVMVGLKTTTDYIPEKFFIEKPIGYALNWVKQKVDDLFNFEWSPADDLSSSSGASTFRQGKTYHGIPYHSEWIRASNVGWHVSKHTFMNAVNDENSVFYECGSHYYTTGSNNQNKNPYMILDNAKIRTTGPYYGLVCSSFGCLITGFSRPMSNYGLMKDCHTYIQKTVRPVLGGLMTNGWTHCIVPIQFASGESNSGHYCVTTVEESAPITLYQNIYDGISFSWTGAGVRSNFIDNYQFHCVPKNWENSTPYDIKTSTITGGDARPYKGDRCVYTSKENVIINIKNTAATTLYVQKCSQKIYTSEPGEPQSGDLWIDANKIYQRASNKWNAVTSDSITVDLNLAGSATEIPIDPGTTRVTLKTVAGDEWEEVFPSTKLAGIKSHIAESIGDNQSMSLTDGIYAVWTNTSTTKEYFEYHDVSTNSFWGEETINNVVVPASKIVDGTLTTNKKFWYAICWGENKNSPARSDKLAGNVTIPYQPPIDIRGNGTGKCDYSNYREKIYLTSIQAVFAKGIFGAYVIANTTVEEAEDEDENPVE